MKHTHNSRLNQDALECGASVSLAVFADHRKYLEVYNLPAYSPQLNALERIWHHTRLHGTHNRYFVSQEELHAVSTSTFRSIRKKTVSGYGLFTSVSIIIMSLYLCNII